MPATTKSETWTEAELDACVKIYFEMLSKEKKGIQYKKSDYRTQILAEALSKRTAGSFEFRMQNISHVLNILGQQYIKVYAPAKNLGISTFASIRKLLGRADPAECFTDGFIPCSLYELFPTYLSEPKSIIIDESKRIKKMLFAIYKNQKSLLDLNPWEFEEAIAELLYKDGYKVELTQKTKDNGYDIIAMLNVKDQFPMKYLVECKRYTKKKVGIEIVRSFKEVLATEKANRGIIVTTSYFTKGALDKQSETPYLLDYRDKDKIIEWVKSYFTSP